MKYSTEYLFGHKPERYAKLQRPLAEMKIADGKALCREIAEKLDLQDRSQEMAERRKHLNDVVEAVEHWMKILEELE